LAHGWVGDGLELGVVWGGFFGHFGKRLGTLGFCIQMLESMHVRCGCLAYNLDLFRFFSDSFVQFVSHRNFLLPNK
jgi:hypothetical protein